MIYKMPLSIDFMRVQGLFFFKRYYKGTIKLLIFYNFISTSRLKNIIK